MGCCEGKLPNPDERLAADSIVAFGSLEHGTQLAQVRLSEASNPDLYVCAFFCHFSTGACFCQDAEQSVSVVLLVMPLLELRFLKVHPPRPGGPFLPCNPAM